MNTSIQDTTEITPMDDIAIAPEELCALNGTYQDGKDRYRCCICKDETPDPMDHLVAEHGAYPLRDLL